MIHQTKKFLSTLSLRRATVCVCELVWGVSISIHALLAESDRLSIAFKSIICLFLSTLSLRRATLLQDSVWVQGRNFYPRSPCGERQTAICRPARPTPISIHALLAESDRVPLAESTAESISIHALLAESDFGLCKGVLVLRNFYPRSPCGERLLGRGEVGLRM